MARDGHVHTETPPPPLQGRHEGNADTVAGGGDDGGGDKVALTVAGDYHHHPYMYMKTNNRYEKKQSQMFADLSDVTRDAAAADTAAAVAHAREVWP